MGEADKALMGDTAGMVALHGVEWSASRTPFSRASCSRVTGMKEPIPQTTKTWAGLVGSGEGDGGDGGRM